LNESDRAIAAHVNCDHTTVAQVIRKHQATGSVHDLPRSGRKRKLDEADMDTLKAVIKEDDMLTSPAIAEELESRTGKSVSERSIRRLRREIGGHPVKGIRVPDWTESQVAKRLEYCEDHADDDFSKTVFTDEKLFIVDKRGIVHWIIRGEQSPLFVPTKKFTAQVMVWGAVGWSGKADLYFLQEKEALNAEKYLEILEAADLPAFRDKKRWRFQHDLATPHQAKTVKQSIKQNKINWLKDYPPNAADLSVMDHVWSWMSKCVRDKLPNSRDELVDAIQEAWSELPQAMIQGYIRHVCGAMKECRDNGGLQVI
jgi:transposase